MAGVLVAGEMRDTVTIGADSSDEGERESVVITDDALNSHKKRLYEPEWTNEHVRQDQVRVVFVFFNNNFEHFNFSPTPGTNVQHEKERAKCPGDIASFSRTHVIVLAVINRHINHSNLNNLLKKTKKILQICLNPISAAHLRNT